MKNETLIFSFVLLVNVLISSLSQLLLKKAAMRQYDSVIKSYLNPQVIIAYSIFLLTSLLSVLALRYVPLSLSVILEASAYIYIPVLGHFFLKERINRRILAGICLIVVGIVLSSL